MTLLNAEDQVLKREATEIKGEERGAWRVSGSPRHLPILVQYRDALRLSQPYNRVKFIIFNESLTGCPLTC